jgi:hypothetical protein
MSSIAYNPEIHEYRDGGLVVPGMTTVLAGMGQRSGPECRVDEARGKR